MTMVKFADSMSPDVVTFYKVVRPTGGMGDTRNTFPNPGEEYPASVQQTQADRRDAQGRVYTTTIHEVWLDDMVAAEPGDKFEHVDKFNVLHKLIVEGHPEPRGIGDVCVSIPCVEVK